MAATMGSSETTAAAAGQHGRRAPRPVRDAALHAATTWPTTSSTGSTWARKLGEATATMPSCRRIFCVNWFRKDAPKASSCGQDIGDNMRVLKWMLDRLEGNGGGNEHVFGVSPGYADLNWDGLDFSQEQFDTVTRIDAAEWQAEMKLHDELFAQLAFHLPAALPAVKARIEERLAKAAG